MLLCALCSRREGELWFLKPSLTWHKAGCFYICYMAGEVGWCSWCHRAGQQARNVNGRNVSLHSPVLQVPDQICLPSSKSSSRSLKWTQLSLDWNYWINFFHKAFLPSHHGKITVNDIVSTSFNIYILKRHKQEVYYSFQIASWFHFITI